MRTMHDTAETAASEGPAAQLAAEPPPAPVIRKGLAGLVAERREQRRADKNDAFERKRTRRRDKIERKQQRADTPSAWSRLRTGLKRLPSWILGAGVSVGWLMALAGSGVGQLAWWSSQFPLVLAAAFAVAFEAIMIGAGRKARDRRMKNRSAFALRLVAWSAATTAAALNWFHLSDPATIITAFGTTVTGSTALGAAFALFTAGGFIVHELAENAAVNDALRDSGHIHPLGARWLFLPSAIRTRLLMIDRVGMTADEAWERVRRPRRARWTARTAFALGRATSSRPKPESAPQTDAEQQDGETQDGETQPEAVHVAADDEPQGQVRRPRRARWTKSRRASSRTKRDTDDAVPQQEDQPAPTAAVEEDRTARQVDELTAQLADRDRPVAAAATANEQDPTVTTILDPVPAPGDELGDHDNQDAQLAELAEILAAGTDVTGARVAEMYGCSERTGRRLVNRARYWHGHHRSPAAMSGPTFAVGRN